MTLEDLVAHYPHVPVEQQIRFLSRLAAELTVWARGTYEAGTDCVVDPPRLRQFNEFQHQVTGQLVKLIGGQEDRYPDDVFAATIAEAAREVQCARAMVGVFQHALPRAAVAPTD